MRQHPKPHVNATATHAALLSSSLLSFNPEFDGIVLTRQSAHNSGHDLGWLSLMTSLLR